MVALAASPLAPLLALLTLATIASLSDNSTGGRVRVGGGRAEDAVIGCSTVHCSGRKPLGVWRCRGVY